MHGRVPSAILVFALLIPLPAAGQGSTPPVLTIPFVHHVPSIEDFVRAQEEPDAHTAGMTMVDRLIQRAPADGAAVSEQTRAFIGYDIENLYAAFICFDRHPAAVRGQLVAREHIPDDDDNVSLQLDTFGDRKYAYGFQVSAAGVQRDAMWTESEGEWDFSFDAIWRAESRRTPFGYVVLITVPFSSLRFAAGREQRWGLFFFREIPRKGEMAFWPAYSPRVAGRLTQAATALGVREIVSSRNVQLTPYTTMDIGGTNAGADAKWVIRNSYVVDATLRPDFSQVESDEPQVTVNERFEKFFPEKRPFFLENASYFSTPIALLFTRRIVDPRLGIRLTGKQGRYGVGALVVDDEAPGGVQSERAVVAAARVTRNIGGDGFVGASLLSRDHGTESNRAASVDGRFAMGSNWTAVWQAVTTTTGPAYAARVVRAGRSFNYNAEWHDHGAGFRAETGYVPRTDFRSLDQTLAYRFHPSGRRLVAWGPEVSVAHVWDRRGTRLDRAVTPRLRFEWTSPVSLALFHTVARQRLRAAEVDAVVEPLDTDAGRSGIELTFLGSRHLAWSAAASRGATVNLRPITNGELRPAADVEATLTASARVAPGLTVDATFLSRRMADRQSAASILRNDIWRVKASYQLTRQLGLRTIVQHDTLASNAAATTVGRYNDVVRDFLLTYMTVPGRALFVGATQHREGWQLFAKISYAFQL